MPRYDLPNAAPAPLRLVQLFVNSEDVENHVDWLGTTAELRAWLTDQGLPHSGARLADAHELRAALRSLLYANNGGPVDPSALATVNRYASRLTLDEDAELALSTGPGPWPAIVAVAFDAMLDGNWDRLKACPQCRWAFYDYSKNRSASWCSMQLCGNRRKTRRYRRRKTAA